MPSDVLPANSMSWRMGPPSDASSAMMPDAARWVTSYRAAADRVHKVRIHSSRMRMYTSSRVGREIEVA
jgi:hypothetical protein